MKKMMKKSITLIVLVAISAVSLSSARTLSDIKESNILKVGVPGDYAPLAFMNENSELAGFDVDMITHFADMNGIKIEFVHSSWPTLSADLKADKFDIAIGGVTYTDKRAQEFLLSEAILPNGKIALARCSIANELSDFSKINQPSTILVVNPGGTNQSFVDERINKANVVRVKDNFENLQALREERADVMITDLIEGNYYEFTEPNVLCLATQTPFEGTESYKAYMINQSDEDLLEAVDLWLNSVDKTVYATKWGIQL